MVLYTADTHFFDPNMVRFERVNDPTTQHFQSVEERDEGIVTRWNNIVTDDDDVYMIGDIVIANRLHAIEILSRLNGRKHIIMGNHDGSYIKSLTNGKNATRVVEVTEGIQRIGDEGRDVIMCHYPLMAWERQHKGSYHIYGHLHATQEETLFQQAGKRFAQAAGMTEFRAMNAGVMLNEYRPMTLGQLCMKNNIGGVWSDEVSDISEEVG